MEQKYIYSFSQIEDKVKALHEINTEAAAAVALSWLGLSRDELKTAQCECSTLQAEWCTSVKIL
mgnify:CR=1 FL=1